MVASSTSFSGTSPRNVGASTACGGAQRYGAVLASLTSASEWEKREKGKLVSDGLHYGVLGLQIGEKE